MPSILEQKLDALLKGLDDIKPKVERWRLQERLRSNEQLTAKEA